MQINRQNNMISPKTFTDKSSELVILVTVLSLIEW